MDPNEPRDDTADSERLMNLVGDLAMAIGRAKFAGAQPDDILVCLAQAVGEYVAETPNLPPISAILTNMAITSRRAHAHRLHANERLDGEQG